MRILSQDGTIDVPYETSILHIVTSTKAEYSKSFIFYTPNNSMDSNELARYSNEAKAQKAMEMLHRAYIGMPVIAVKDVDMDVKEISDAIRNGFVQPMPLNEQKIECDIFKFPRDEEVEVQDEQ